MLVIIQPKYIACIIQPKYLKIWLFLIRIEICNHKSKAIAGQGGPNFSKETLSKRAPLPVLPQKLQQYNLCLCISPYMTGGKCPPTMSAAKCHSFRAGLSTHTLKCQGRPAFRILSKPFLPSHSQISWQGSGMSQHGLENKQQPALPYT